METKQKNNSSENGKSSNYVNELSFISAAPTVDAHVMPNTNNVDSNAVEKAESLADGLAFIAQDPVKSGTSDVEELHEDEHAEESLVEDLHFISQANKDANNSRNDERGHFLPLADDRVSSTSAKIPQEVDVNNESNTNGEEMESNLADDLAFIAQDPVKSGTSNVIKLHRDGQTEESSVEELHFISQANKEANSTSAGTSPEEVDDTNESNAVGEKIGGNLADDLAFIAQDSSKREKTKHTKIGSILMPTVRANSKTKQGTLVEDLEFISNASAKRKNGEKNNASNKKKKQRKKDRKKRMQVQFNVEKSRKSTETKEILSMPDNSGDGTRQLPVKHIIATFLFSTVAMLMTFANLRIGLHLFCPYDDEIGTYIVMKEVAQCPVPVERNDNYCDEPFWKNKKNKQPTVDDEFVKYVPAPASKRHESLCRGTFNVLHACAALLHPRINYKSTMPQVHIHSPCPELIENTQKKSGMKKTLKKIFAKIKCVVEKKVKRDKLNVEESKAEIEMANEDNFDWAFLVSMPLELNLTPKQIALAKKVSNNLKDNLGKNNLELSSKESTFEEIMDRVKFGGRFSWWFPEKDGQDMDDNEFSGLRLIAAYMTIMDWPENLITNFPGSGICAQGCPADFAISNTLEFREKYQPWKMTPSAMKENELGWTYVRGYSPTRYHEDPQVGGASILWLTPGLFKMQDSEAYGRALLHSLDNCVADALFRSGGKIGKCNVVLDCNDVGFSKIPPIGPTKTLLKKMQDNYPHKLGVFVIANVSGASQMFLKLLLPLLPEVVRQKIQILPNDDKERLIMLEELVHTEFIPVRLGGTDRYTFDAETYYKSSQYGAEFLTDEEGKEYHQTMPYYST